MNITECVNCADDITYRYVESSAPGKPLVAIIPDFCCWCGWDQNE